MPRPKPIEVGNHLYPYDGSLSILKAKSLFGCKVSSIHKLYNVRSATYWYNGKKEMLVWLIKKTS